MTCSGYHRRGQVSVVERRMPNRGPAARCTIAERARQLRCRCTHVDLEVVPQNEMPVRVHCALQQQPLRIPVVPLVEVHERRIPEQRGRHEVQPEPVAPVLQIGALQISEIVRLEARRQAIVRRLEARDASTHLAERDLLGVAAEGSARGIQVQRAIRLLEVVHGIGLRCENRGRRAADTARINGAGELEPAIREPMPEVRGRNIRIAVEQIMRPAIVVAIDTGEENADATLAAAKILLRSQHGVVRARLDV